jgi:hypothetical protein
MQVSTWKSWLIRILLFVWGLQIIWLAWHFAPEAGDMVKRLVQGNWGEAVRQEDPFYRWLEDLASVIPPRAAYIFLDQYEAGKEIEASYHLYPRRHTLLSPQAPPSFLYFDMRRYQASYLLVRQRQQAIAPETRAAMHSPAFRPVKLPGSGLVFKVDHTLIHGDFYD